MAVKISKLPNH